MIFFYSNFVIIIMENFVIEGLIFDGIVGDFIVINIERGWDYGLLFYVNF